MKYFIKTYGCQMNYSDSERIAMVLELANYKKTVEESDADLIVLNMCSIRESAVNRISGNFKKYKKYKQKNPNLKTVLTGCILPDDKKKFEKLFDLIINIKEIQKLPEQLKDCYFKDNNNGIKNRNTRQKKSDSSIKTQNTNDYFNITPKYENKITAYVPIMTGCDNFCSYCIVPYTRGREYSRPSKEILNEIKNLIQKGYKEIILLGQNVNSYKPDKNTNFPKLLQLINNISGDFWIRFLTSHPKDISEKLIKTISNCEKCTAYIHLALQSGDDKILEKMNRKYDTKHFLNLIEMIRKHLPSVAITTDIIVGFPGETEKQFQNTAILIKKIKFDMIYINKYSPRAGTVSATMDNNISWEEKKRREGILNTILEKTAFENNQKYIEKIEKILIEKIEGNYAYGKTKSFKNIKIKLETKKEKSTIKAGDFINIKIIKINIWGLEGKI